MKEGKNHSALLVAGLLFGLAATLLLLPVWSKRGRRYASYLPAPAAVAAAEVDSWTRAVNELKADHGEPSGRQARVEIPHELKHYSDTRRFLAVQVAEWREHALQTPEDFVDLAGLIRSGKIVPLKQLTSDYILFGVGGNADKGPFTRYESGHRIPLYSEGGLAREYARLEESCAVLTNEIARLKKEFSSLKRRDRATRAKLQVEIKGKEAGLKTEREQLELLDRHYGDAEQRRQLFEDHRSLETLAESYSDRSFDIEDPSERRALKVRMLSGLRPEALKVMEEIAASYREKFDRLLPITSLVRPDEYQHALRKVNPNATQIDTPPHSTGLAFDIYYRYMTATEQSHVMAHLAQLKEEGRIEVLRENRDHYHVFAFIDGRRPSERLIRASLGNTRSPHLRETMREAPLSHRALNASNTRSSRTAIKNKRAGTLVRTTKARGGVRKAKARAKSR